MQRMKPLRRRNAEVWQSKIRLSPWSAAGDVAIKGQQNQPTKDLTARARFVDKP